MENLAQDRLFLLMVLVFPALFGLVLLGEGVHKIVNYDNTGWISTIAGVVFIGVVVFGYLYITSFLGGL